MSPFRSIYRQTQTERRCVYWWDVIVSTVIMGCGEHYRVPHILGLVLFLAALLWFWPSWVACFGRVETFLLSVTLLLNIRDVKWPTAAKQNSIRPAHGRTITAAQLFRASSHTAAEKKKKDVDLLISLKHLHTQTSVFCWTVLGKQFWTVAFQNTDRSSFKQQSSWHFTKEIQTLFLHSLQIHVGISLDSNTDAITVKKY